MEKKNNISRKEGKTVIVLDPEYLISQPMFGADGKLMGQIMAHSIQGLAINMVAIHAATHARKEFVARTTFQGGKYVVTLYDTMEEMEKDVFGKKSSGKGT